VAEEAGGWAGTGRAVSIAVSALGGVAAIGGLAAGAFAVATTTGGAAGRAKTTGALRGVEDIRLASNALAPISARARDET
jgi:hypothetical protein